MGFSLKKKRRKAANIIHSVVLALIISLKAGLLLMFDKSRYNNALMQGLISCTIRLPAKKNERVRMRTTNDGNTIKNPNKLTRLRKTFDYHSVAIFPTPLLAPGRGKCSRKRHDDNGVVSSPNTVVVFLSNVFYWSVFNR